jgi:hypothetical protein
VPKRALSRALGEKQIEHYLIDGAGIALQLDAKRAIDQGTRLAFKILKYDLDGATLL